MILSRNPHAFTLVELMIVIAIVGILATALFPYLSQYQDRARDSEKRSNAETLALALQNYMLENQTWRTNGGWEWWSGSGVADYASPPYKSIAKSLEDQWFLGKWIIKDVASTNESKYRVSGCNDMTFSVGTILTIPTRSDKEKLVYACDWVWTPTSLSGVWMNFATTHGNFCVPRKEDGSVFNCQGDDVTQHSGN